VTALRGEAYLLVFMTLKDAVYVGSVMFKQLGIICQPSPACHSFPSEAELERALIG